MQLTAIMTTTVQQLLPSVSRIPTLLQVLILLIAACAACLSLAEGKVHKLEPNLHSVIGANAGSHEDFAFSPTLRNSGLTWTGENLMVWITDSETIPPSNLLSVAEVAALLDYLHKAGA